MGKTVSTSELIGLILLILWNIIVVYFLATVAPVVAFFQAALATLNIIVYLESIYG